MLLILDYHYYHFFEGMGPIGFYFGRFLSLLVVWSVYDNLLFNWLKWVEGL